MRKNPHMWLTALDPPRDFPPRRWRCQYCNETGLMDDLRAIACSYVYPPCKDCGQTPECSLTCAGIARALGDPSVHIATGDPDGMPEA